MKMSKWFINSGRVVCALLLLLGAGAWADEAAWKKLSEQTRDRFGVGDDREAERLARYAVAEARQSFGENDARTATSLDTLARILVLSGKPVEAEIQWRNALHIRAAVFGPEARVTGLTYVNIATAMIRSGQITEGEAEAMLGQALRIFEKTDGVNSKNYAAALHSLGAVRLVTRQYAEAETVLKQALAIREKVEGADSLETSRTLRNLALAAEGQGREEDARAYQARAEAILGTADVSVQ